jgi:enediyne polyketide synthase
MAGFGAASVAYFEAHGTGTAVGDPTELAAIASVRRESATFPAVVGSIKANIGLTKAAAGLAGLIKATMALNQRVLPPGCGREQPHPAFAEAADVLAAPGEGRAWPRALPLRAGVSAMGFGGINTHLALEGEGPRRRSAVDAQMRRLLATPQDAELFPARRARSRDADLGGGTAGRACAGAVTRRTDRRSGGARRAARWRSLAGRGRGRNAR